MLDADAPEASASSERILSDLSGKQSGAPSATRPRRWLWPLALVLTGLAAVLLLVFGGAFESMPSTTSTTSTPVANSVDADATMYGASTDSASPTSPYAAMPSAQGDADTSAAMPDGAVIFSGLPSAAASSMAAVPAPASSANKEAVALSAMLTPAAERKHVAARKPAPRRASRRSDSDVALLAALIHHVEEGDPALRKQLQRIPAAREKAHPRDLIEVRMQACPAANTTAGLRCRQRLCDGHSGQTPSCPAASPEGA